MRAALLWFTISNADPSGPPTPNEQWRWQNESNPGTVWVNRHLNMPVDVPLGGAKQSGLGRERGIAGLEEFSQTKIINAAKTVRT